MFIISDGESTDGDPIPIAKKIKKLGWVKTIFFIN